MGIRQGQDDDMKLHLTERDEPRHEMGRDNVYLTFYGVDYIYFGRMRKMGHVLPPLWPKKGRWAIAVLNQL